MVVLAFRVLGRGGAVGKKERQIIRLRGKVGIRFKYCFGFVKLRGLNLTCIVSIKGSEVGKQIQLCAPRCDILQALCWKAPLLLANTNLFINKCR